jgi:hypothetical protein
LIARLWRGWTAARDARGYERWLDRTALRRMLEAEGNHGVLVLSRREGERAEFVVVSLWSSLDRCRAFEDAYGGLELDSRLLEASVEVHEYRGTIRGDLALGAAAALEP